MRKKKLERYRALIQESRDFLDNIVPARRTANPAYDFRSDEAYIAREAEITELQMWLDEDRQIEERERAFDARQREREGNAGGGSRGGADDEQTREQQTNALISYIRTGTNIDQLQRFMAANAQERAALASNGTTTGGYMVPEFVSANVIQDLESLETVRRLGAEVMPVMGNENVASIADAVANFIAEEGSVTATDPTTGVVQVRPNLLVCQTSMSWQWLNRAVGNPMAQIQRAFTRGIAKTEGQKFLVGDGSDEPQGLVTGSAEGVAAADDVTFTGLELMSLFYSVHPSHQANGTWIFSPSAAQYARSLETANGDALIVPNLKDGMATLMGRPVVIDPYMDALEASKKPIVFGDVEEAYLIGEEIGLTVLSDPYTVAANGRVKLYVYKFVDGRTKKAAAVKHLLTHA